MARRILLACGILASALYVAMNVFVPMLWNGYSSASQTVSELSAIGAPTRAVWVPLGLLYTLLMAAFGIGVRLSAGHNRALRAAGVLLFLYGVIGLAWPPMHLREVLAAGGATRTDTMHLVFAMLTVLVMLTTMGFGAAAFGAGFRLYSVLTMILQFGFGALTTIDAPRVQANLPTPLVGVWERINIALFLIWVVVLAATLLRARRDAHAVLPAN